MPLAVPRTTLASSQRPYGSLRWMLTGVPQPMAVGSTAVLTPAGASPCSSTYAGIPPGQLVEASRNLRSLSTRSRSSSMPIVSSSHFMRARSLLSRLP